MYDAGYSSTYNLSNQTLCHEEKLSFMGQASVQNQEDKIVLKQITN